MTQKEIEIKKKKIYDLYISVEVTTKIFPLIDFFDYESDELLDEKIEVFTALKEGKTISEIPNFYDVFELYPRDDEVKDGLCTYTAW